MMGLVSERFRLVAVSVKFVATPSMVSEDQEMFRDPSPFSVAVKLKGAEGGPEGILL